MKNALQQSNITEKNLQELSSKATDYLASRGYATSGVVVFYNDEVQGWVNKLRDPQHWMPGCIAVTNGGSFYVTTGGDNYNGAQLWEPIPTAPKEPIVAPAIGQYWPGQGGIYAGMVRDGNDQWHLILAEQGVAYTEGKWGNSGETIPGEFSRRDGKHNTALILAAEPKNEIATYITALEIDGHRDFYWPAQCENNLLFNNLSTNLGPKWHWSSTQGSARHAWSQHFEDGGQDVSGKNRSLAARAVRRLPI